jgi:5-carboxymethyl-2-hydroxymuconate isomerase
MPRLHLETTADLLENSDIPDILEALLNHAAREDGMESSIYSAYHSLRSVWQMGAGARPAFVNLTVYLSAGTGVDWKKKLVESLAEELRSRFSYSIEMNEAELSIALVEYDPSASFRLG